MGKKVWKDLDRTDLLAVARLEADFKYTREEVADAVDNPYWQKVRRFMKGLNTRQKLGTLMLYRNEMHHSRPACIRVDNYLNALRRGGQLPAKSMQTYLIKEGFNG